MAEIRDAAFLLRSIPYSETSLIVHVLTRDHGRIALMARGARRAKSSFRATLAPLYHLRLAWRPGRTGMGTLVDVERGAGVLDEMRSLEGLRLNALAAGLFREGGEHGYTELEHAFCVLSERKEDSGLLAGAWALLLAEGWLGSLDCCWRCAGSGDEFYWRDAELCCAGCGKGMPVSVGLRKGILGHMHSPKVLLPVRDLKVWAQMIQDILRQHGLKKL